MMYMNQKPFKGSFGPPGASDVNHGLASQIVHAADLRQAILQQRHEASALVWAMYNGTNL